MNEENNDRKAQEAVENRDRAPAPAGTPSDAKPAGPHAKDNLTEPEKTPGTGSLAGDSDGETDVGPD